MSSVEVLSPAGSWLALKAAVEEGADAVYFGVDVFNARRRAENFKQSDLKKVVEYCHERGVRAYLTANVLVKNNELKNYFNLVEQAYIAGVDAIIIQDLAFIPLIKESLSDLGVHVSTQAGVFNSYFKKILEKADRVILPREFTLKQVKEFHEKTNLDVEVFIQGALCYSISGQCLMSSFLGGRSGNRGLCAQPCRKRYNGKYFMSTRDLCLAEKLQDFAAAGVCSLKIEGRLRSPEYVAAATAVYRRALDTQKVDKEAMMDLMLAFNREYTRGGMFKEFDIATPEASRKRGVYAGKLGENGFIKLNVSVKKGDGVGVITSLGAHGDLIRRIEFNGKETDVGNLGQTVRLFLNAKKGDEIFITSGVQRRQNYKIPKKKELKISRSKKEILMPEIKSRQFTETKLLAKVYSKADAETALKTGADRVYYNIFAKDFPRDGTTGAYIPRCLNEWNALKALSIAESLKPKSILSGDLGIAMQLKDCEVYLDISGNAFNDIDVEYCNKLGLKPVISPELSLKEMKDFSDKRFAVYTHGRIPLMATKYVLNESKLTDEKRYVFPVRGELDYKQILNSVPLGLYEGILKLRREGIVEYMLDLEEDVRETISLYRNILEGVKHKKPKTHTLGHFERGVA